MREFYCTICKVYFIATEYWDNPVFLADLVTNHTCGAKCWETDASKKRNG